MKSSAGRKTGYLILSAVIFLIAALVLTANRTLAQESISNANGQVGASSQSLSLSGSVGIYGELYDKSRGIDRRPSSSARLFFRPTLSIYKSFSISTNMILSTEGNSNRQNINQIDFNPRWQWGYAHAGDFTDTYSSLTLNGIRIRGGGVSINPGTFRLAAVVGQTRRATSNTSSNRSFSRSLYGGKIGIGKQGGSFIDLIVLKSRDKSSSLPDLQDSSIASDTTVADSVINPWSIFPADNFITAIASNLKMFNKKVTWANEISGCAYTRNTEGKKLTNEDIPSWVDKVFKVRIGSRVDVGYKTDLSYASKKWSFSSGYDFIGPGYISLGLSSLMSDRQAIRLGCTYRQKNWTAAINGIRENDNLIDQKIFTTVRQRVSGILNLRPTKWWNVVFTTSLLTMNNDAKNDTSLIDNTNALFGINQIFTPVGHRKIQSLSLNVVSQRSNDTNPLRDNADLKSYSADFRMTIEATSYLSLTPALGLASTKIGTEKSKTITTIILNAQHKALAERLSTNITLGPSFSSDANTFRVILMSSYKLTRVDQIQTELKLNKFNSDSTEPDYNETIWNLSFTHKF